MNSEDLEDFTNFEEQLKDIAKKICIIENDENPDIWKINNVKSSKKVQEDGDGETNFGTLKKSNIFKCNRISPEESQSSSGKCFDYGKTSRNTEINSKSFAGNSNNDQNGKAGVKGNIVQGIEKLKELSFLNRPTVSQMAQTWNNKDVDNLFPAHRSALSVKNSSPVKGTIISNPHVKSDVNGKLLKNKELPSVANNGHSTLTRRGIFPTRQISSDPEEGFRKRGMSSDRSFHLHYKPCQKGNTADAKMQGHQQQFGSNWMSKRHGSELGKTNSLETNQQNDMRLLGHSGKLGRAGSLLKFDDDDEYLQSPPTTRTEPTDSSSARWSDSRSTSSGSSSRLNLTKVKDCGASSRDSSLLCSPAGLNSSRTGFPDIQQAMTPTGSGKASLCSAHGCSSPTSPGSSAPFSRNDGPFTSPYATLLRSSGRKKMGERDERLIQPQSIRSLPMSPSSRLAEDIQATEIRRLRQDLQWAKEQVTLLTSRLCTNANVVDAFDQSLSNMANRLQLLSGTSNNKNHELKELLDTIESLRRQNRNQKSCEDESALPVTPQSINSGQPHFVYNNVGFSSRHQPMSDSVTSIASSNASVGSETSRQSNTAEQSVKKNSVKSWLRSSFGKAFSRKKSGIGQKSSPADHSVPHANSMPSIPCHGYPGVLNEHLKPMDSRDQLQFHAPRNLVRQSSPAYSLSSNGGHSGVFGPINNQGIGSIPSPISLQIPNQNHGFPYMKGNRGDNFMQPSSMISSQYRPSTANPTSSVHKRSESLDHNLKILRPTCLDLLRKDQPDGHNVTISVAVNSTEDPTKPNQGIVTELVIGTLNVGDRTSWDMLDSMVRRVFQEHLIRLDPATSLGLNGESVLSYKVGEVIRSKESGTPELLPIGYLVGEVSNITVSLKGNKEGTVDQLAFETLIPKSIIHRYLQLLLDHRRIILSGSSGTGKTYLAQKIADYLVARINHGYGQLLLNSIRFCGPNETKSDCVSIFRVDTQSSRELRQYLTSMADQCERRTEQSGDRRLPTVVILDNLHHVSSLSDVFSGFLDTGYQNSPYIIGTMNQATCSTTDLQLHHNFRWVLYANHIEPVRSFLGRFLRRCLITSEATSRSRTNLELNKIIEWLPKVWQHVNKFLETHSSCDITIGPRLFLSCPMDISQAQIWFADLWNYSIVPYLMEAVKDGIQTYGCRAPWEDLADWIIESYPWSKQLENGPALLRLRPEDVGYENKSQQSADKIGNESTSSRITPFDMSNDSETSLLDIVTRLQEAAVHSDSEGSSTNEHFSRQDSVICIPSMLDATNTHEARTSIL